MSLSIPRTKHGEADLCFTAYLICKKKKKTAGKIQFLDLNSFKSMQHLISSLQNNLSKKKLLYTEHILYTLSISLGLSSVVFVIFFYDFCDDFNVVMIYCLLDLCFYDMNYITAHFFLCFLLCKVLLLALLLKCAIQKRFYFLPNLLYPFKLTLVVYY